LTVAKRFIGGAVLFALFVLCYSLPLALDASVAAIGGQLLDELLASAAVRQELLRNGLALLGLLLAVHMACGWVGTRVARKAGQSVFLVRLLLLFVAWLGLMAANAWLFPASNYSVAFRLVAGPLWAVVWFSVLLAALLCAALPLRRNTWVALSGLLLGGAACSTWLSAPVAETVGRTGERNIILIGIDSLSAEAFENNPEQLPALTGLMGRAQRYSRAYTPFGRTFPAWVSILSGRLPAEHGAVFNLRNMEHVDRQTLLSSTLREMGYRTVFAIDERRFANIDESFGFDLVVGPKAGALDFALQGINDTPLSNVLLQTSLAAYLFPYSYVNVASHTNYSADGFVERILDSLQGDRSHFLAVHFESAHFPFKSRHVQVDVPRDNRFMGRYLQTLTVVDRQVEQLVAGLRARGLLEDALVVLLSDHGEALGDVEASVLRDGEPYEVSSFGHGANLLSDRQNRILLGLARYRGGEPVGAHGVDARQVSLVSLRSAVESFARSGYVTPLAEGCLIVETGIRFAVAEDYRTLKEEDVAEHAASFYEVDQQGRLRLREDRLPELLAMKDIGWRCADRLTWYESASKRYFAYRLDAQGLPAEQLEPAIEDVAHIQAYQERYRGQ
jgi:hypothetical protein